MNGIIGQQLLHEGYEINTVESSLLALADNLEGAERAMFRGMLSNVVQSVCPTGHFPKDQNVLARFRSAIKVLGVMQRHPRMTSNGVCYLGRPEFLTDELLAAIQKEAREDVRPRAIWQRGHMLGLGGVIGDRIAKGNELRELVEINAGTVEATGVASYLFYEEEGSGLSAHVDTEIFALNVNILLQHDSVGPKSSHLFIFSVDGNTREEIFLQPGEMIVTFGDSVVHGRSPLQKSEFVSNLTIGFQPSGWEI